MQAYWKVVLCYFVLSFYACTTGKENNILLHPTGKTLSFSLPQKASAFSLCIRYHNGQLYFLEDFSSDIFVFKMDTKMLAHIITVPQDPPDRIGRIRGFSILHNDTLVIEPNETSDLVIINDAGGVIKYIPLDESPEHGIVLNATSLRSLDGSDVFCQNKTLVILQYPYTLVHLPGKVEQEDLARFRMFYLYDLQTGEGRFSAFGLPKNYFEKGKVLAGFSVIRMPGRYVYACKLDSDLFWTDDFEDFHTVPHESRYIPERIPTFNPADPDPYAWLAGTNEYTGFYYDPWRNVAYRFARLAVSPELLQQADYDYEQVVLHPPDWIVQVFDEELNMLCEQRFTGHRYSPHNAFVTPEGLYVSISNPMRADYTEDSLRFELFELVLK